MSCRSEALLNLLTSLVIYRVLVLPGCRHHSFVSPSACSLLHLHRGVPVEAQADRLSTSTPGQGFSQYTAILREASPGPKRYFHSHNIEAKLSIPVHAPARAPTIKSQLRNRHPIQSAVSSPELLKQLFHKEFYSEEEVMDGREEQAVTALLLGDAGCGKSTFLS